MLGRGLPEVDPLAERVRFDAQDFHTVNAHDSACGPIAMVHLDTAQAPVEGHGKGAAAHWWDNENGG
jgi:hypothetical protein